MPVSEAIRQDLAVLRRRLMTESRPDVFDRIKEDFEIVSFKAACEDPWFFLRNLCKTRNEHAGDDDPYQPFPDLDYVKHLLDTWVKVEQRPSSRLLLIAKSRQMMVSWMACAMVLWNCLSRKARRVGWQSKKSEDADQMLERIYGLWQRLPEPIKERNPCERKYLYLRFPTTDCDVHAIPQGPDQVRSYTWSLFISDEMAFQEADDKSYYALLPALGKNGMGVLISTAGPGHFEQLYNDTTEA